MITKKMSFISVQVISGSFEQNNQHKIMHQRSRCLVYFQVGDTFENCSHRTFGLILERRVRTCNFRKEGILKIHKNDH